MRRATYQHLLDDLAGLSAPEEVKRQFEELIRQRAALDGIASIDRSERVKFARQLLDQREPRPTINTYPNRSVGAGTAGGDAISRTDHSCLLVSRSGWSYPSGRSHP
jgi:hypothetical protein